MPQLVGVDEVLPEDIAAGTDAGLGGQVGVGDPDGEAGVLLEHPLTGADALVGGAANSAANEELNKGGDEREQRDIT